MERGNASSITEVPSVTKNCENTIDHSTQLTPIEGFGNLYKNKVFSNLLGRRKKRKPQFHSENFVLTADIIKVFIKGDCTNWSYNLYTIPEALHDTNPSFRIINLPERYSENLLRSTKLTLDENLRLLKKPTLVRKTPFNKRQGGR